LILIVFSRLVSFLQHSIDEAEDELLFFAGETSDRIEAELQLRGWADSVLDLTALLPHG
jgi:hypothetical protein